MKKGQKTAKVRLFPLSDTGLTRCPDVLSFHASLDRVFEKNYEFGGERHPFYELVYVENGAVGITAEEKIYTLTRGQLLIHPPEEFHRIWSEYGSRPHVRTLSFHAAVMPDSTGRVLQPTEEQERELTRICDAVARALEASDSAALNEQRLCLEFWLSRMIRNDAGGEEISSDAALRYAEIVDVLQTHLQEPLSTAEIARLCNISLSGMKRIFSRYSGMGVSRYFSEMKMRHAADLLRAGRHVGEVAASVGYQDPNYFSTVFRRIMGVPPSAFRPEPESAFPKKAFPNHKKTLNRGRTTMKFITVETYQQLSRQAANLISAQVIMKPDSVLGLATGSSPLGIYRQLIEWYKKGDVDFSAVTSINLDEYVGLREDNPQSYRYFMQENFFRSINIRRENTYVPDGCAADPDAECLAYDANIDRVGGIDLQLLGIGLDGHIGFNEPSDVFIKNTHIVDLHESTIRANARFFEKEEDVPRKAITMGMVSIMQAKKILLIANGPAKKEIVQKAFFGPITPKIPASILQLHPDITVIYSEE